MRRISILITIVWISCNQNGQQVTQNPSTMTVDQVAREKFQEDYQITLNDEKTHALVTKSIKTNPNQLKSTIYLFVFDIAHSSIIYENQIAKATVGWLNNTEILIETEPGVYQPNLDASRIIYDIEEQQEKAYISR